MPRITKKTKLIRNQILKDVADHPNDITSHISALFGITRQSVNKHLKALVESDFLEATGSTRSRVYKLGVNREKKISIQLKGASEHEVYNRYFKDIVSGLDDDIEEIIFYGFTEMLNNAIDHSMGDECYINMERNAEFLTIGITDDGIGIFRKITREMGLSNVEDSLLELSKGKLTTDPANHTGQGIYFTSRCFDIFAILSYNQAFFHRDGDAYDYLLPFDSETDTTADIDGTQILLRIDLSTTRTLEEVFDEYSAGDEDDYSFNKTMVPVKLAQYDKEQLVSRSQAKRVLSRVDQFKYVVMDFEGVDSIGQAFADEIFRVFQLRHPDVEISYRRANEEVERMVRRALS